MCTWGEIAQGEIAQGEIMQGEIVQGEIAQGEIAQGENTQGDIVQGEIAQDETAKGEIAQIRFAKIFTKVEGTSWDMARSGAGSVGQGLRVLWKGWEMGGGFHWFWNAEVVFNVRHQVP